MLSLNLAQCSIPLTLVATRGSCDVAIHRDVCAPS